MSKMNISLEENKLQMIEGKSMIIQIIDEQINHQKFKLLSAWIRDHNVSGEECDRKIARLQSMKRELMDYFNGVNFKDESVNFTLDLEVNLAIEAHNSLSNGQGLLQDVA